MTAHGPQFPTHVNPATGALTMGYCPGRDFINLYPLMLHQVAQHFERGRWDQELHELAGRVGCSFEEAVQAATDVMRAHTEFVRLSCENPDEKFYDVLRRAGWYETRVEARQLLLMAMGELVQGQIFAGIRDVSLAGEMPPKHWQTALTRYWDLSHELLRVPGERELDRILVGDSLVRLLLAEPAECYSALTRAVSRLRRNTEGRAAAYRGELSLWGLLRAVWRGWF